MSKKKVFDRATKIATVKRMLRGEKVKYENTGHDPHFPSLRVRAQKEPARCRRPQEEERARRPRSRTA